MFDSPVLAEPSSVPDGRLPDDELGADPELESLLDRECEHGFEPGFAEGWWDAPTDGGPPPLLPTMALCAPSGWLALELDTGTAELDALSDEAVVEAIVGFDRVSSWAMARQARLIAELARRRPPDPVPDEDGVSVGSRFVPDEVGVALKLARGTAAGRIGTACRLLAVLPDTHALWEAGLIDTAKARAIDEATVVLSDEKAVQVQARVLPRAPGQSLGQLRAALARAILAVDPDGAADRHREARKDRRVLVTPEADGMGSLWALLTASDAAGAYAWLTRLARGLSTDDPRGMDARRADLLAALLNGRLVTDADITTVDHNPGAADPGAADPGAADPGTADGSSGVAADGPTAAAESRSPRRSTAIRPVTPGKPLIPVVMAHSTLIGADNQPAELIGHGPIPADLAREIATDAVWRRIVTDPLSGTVLDYGRTTYHPPAGLADHVRIRDQHCRFPLCRRRAADAELDHIHPWATGGHTSATNLQALCPHHHRLKTHTRWRVEAHPDGRLTWITPTGHRHTTAPHDYGSGVAPPGTSPPGTSPPAASSTDGDGAPASPSTTAPTDDPDAQGALPQPGADEVDLDPPPF